MEACQATHGPVVAYGGMCRAASQRNVVWFARLGKHVAISTN